MNSVWCFFEGLYAGEHMAFLPSLGEELWAWYLNSNEGPSFPCEKVSGDASCLGVSVELK